MTSVTKARTLGPVLLMLLGLAAIALPTTGYLGVGTEIDPCNDRAQIGKVDPCESTTTTAPPSTTSPSSTTPPTSTTAPIPTIVVDTTTTTAPATTTTEVATTEPDTTTPETTPPATAAPSTELEVTATSGDVSGAAADAPGVSGGTLARTGSDGSIASTVAGALLIMLGATLLLMGRRRSNA